MGGGSGLPGGEINFSWAQGTGNKSYLGEGYLKEAVGEKRDSGGSGSMGLRGGRLLFRCTAPEVAPGYSTLKATRGERELDR